MSAEGDSSAAARLPDGTARHLQTAAFILGLAAVYFCAGSFGLSLASVNPSASAVWPPSGIALAAVLLSGYRLWPGVFLGAALVNFAVQRSVVTALTIAAGNTLEAVLGAWLLCRFADGQKTFHCTRNILKFILLAAVLSTTVSAATGVTSLSLAGYARWQDSAAIWLTWWLGDMVGDLLVAAPLVLWVTQPLLPLKAVQVLEAAGLLLAVLLAGWLLFLTSIPFGLEYFALVPLLWGALRFGRRGAVTSALLMSMIALWGTLRHLGPFATLDPDRSLLSLQLFMATIATTALVMASVVSERRRLEERLLIKDAVSRILAEASSPEEAAPKIVEVLCETAGWDLGAMWRVDPASNQLSCIEFWSLPSVHVAEFEALTRHSIFPRGTGLPGRVWASGAPAWILDVTKDDNFPRRLVAAKEGLHAAFCFPIKLTDEVLGVMECLSREVREPDDDFLDMVANLGRQLGQFIERRRAEASLRAKESQVRLITDTTPVMLAQLSRDERFRFVNRAYAERFGRAPNEIVGKTVGEVLGEKAHEAILPYIQRVLQGERVQYEAEVPYERLGRRFMRVEYVPEIDARGQVTGWVSALSDITERKQAEEDLRQARDSLSRSNEELERRVQERTAELAEANAALMRESEAEKRLEEQLRQAQKMESIGTLTGGIAHDFNNILNIIRSHASFIGATRSDDRELGGTLKVIDETVDRGAAIVQQLLAIGRRSEARREPVDANDLVRSLERLLSETFPKTIDIALCLDACMPPLTADRNQIDQVLLNVSLNARDAMPEGGTLFLTTATVPGAELRARFAEVKAQQYAMISVADTGVGMDESVRSRIFEPFFSTKGRGQGTGLGLSVAYGIVANHGGFIDVVSRPNHGATFSIYLPIGEPPRERLASRQAPRPAERKALPAQGHTVLFVEDEVRQVELMRRFLESNGHRVLTAVNGLEAVDLHLRHKDEISVVILDLGLPGLSGWEAFQRMKQANPNLKAVLATGYIAPEIASATSTGELSAVIMKPYQLTEILEVVSSVSAPAARAENVTP